MIGQPRPALRHRRSVLSALLVAPAVLAGVPAAGAAPDHTKATIRYELTGAGVAEYVTYQTNDGQDHATNVSLPWSTEFVGFMKSDGVPGAAYLVSAQGAGPGSISCSVSINGKVFAKNTATGDPARVLCETH